MRHTLLCLAPGPMEAELLLGELHAADIAHANVSILFHNASCSNRVSSVTDASAGGIQGGAFGLLALAEQRRCKQLGRFVAAGPVAAVVANGDDIAWGLGLLGLHANDAKHLERSLLAGRCLVGVRIESDRTQLLVKNIMAAQGAVALLEADDAAPSVPPPPSGTPASFGANR